VIAAVVEAEKIEPSDGDVLEALEPTAERGKTTPEKLMKDLESNGRLTRLRAELANRQAVAWLVEHAKPVTMPVKDEKPASEKTGPKKPAAAKPAADKPAAKKPTAKKPAAKKPAAKKPPAVS
jgi:FKBP-type peptidyl-prolyl cis-trans isomerase (trigger factor)